MKTHYKTIACAAIFHLVCQPALADMASARNGGSGPVEERTTPLTRAEEFFSEEVAGEQLITVQIIGAVTRSGVYHVPRNTDFVRLLSLAGGTRADADPRRAIVKRTNKAEEEIIRVNLTELAERPNIRAPILQAGDMVVVYTKEPLFDRDALSAITVLTSLLSIITSVLVITRSR